MDVRVRPDLQAAIDRWAAETGRPAGELIEEALAGYFDELAQTRTMLERRYDDLKSGRVQPIGGAEALSGLRARSAAHRAARRG